MLDFLKLLLYQIVYLLAKCIPARKGNQHLLIVKVDEIGDYVLARNCLSYIRNSPQYNHHRITFLGNKIFSEVFKEYDRAVADEAIWLDKQKYRKDPFYRFQLLKTLRRGGYSDAVNLIYSRSWRLDDVLVAITGAQMRVGINNDGSHLSIFEKAFRKRNTYTKLLQSGDDRTFDVYRNANFVSELLNHPVPASTQIKVEAPSHLLDAQMNYCVIFPGSGIRDKKWSPENFAKVAAHLLDKWKLAIVVCGSLADKTDGEKFIGRFQQPVHNLIEQTTLPELLTVLRFSKCLVSVDTGVVHLAAAVGCPVFGLFNGLHYGRFAPYPRELADNFFSIYPGNVDSMIADNSIDDTKVQMDFVKDIPAQKVIDAIDAYFQQRRQ
jgi:ADP-heptose:LPS heptosyltransferase